MADWGDDDEALRADSGTDLRARDRTSAVARRSFANLEMANSFAAVFSRSDIRWRFWKSAVA